MKFNKKVLKNGLTILHEKRDVPVTTVMLGSSIYVNYLLVIKQIASDIIKR